MITQQEALDLFNEAPLIAGYPAVLSDVWFFPEYDTKPPSFMACIALGPLGSMLPRVIGYSYFVDTHRYYTRVAAETAVRKDAQ